MGNEGEGKRGNTNVGIGNERVEIRDKDVKLGNKEEELRNTNLKIKDEVEIIK